MRSIKWLMVGVLILGVIVGLRGFSFSQQTVTVTSWQFEEPGYSQFWNEFTAAFEKEHPAIKVERVEIAPGRYWDQIVVLITVGPPPDVMHATAIKIKQFMAMKALDPLDKWMDLTEVKKTFYEAQRIFPVEDGETYGLITGARTLQLIYNKKLFKEAGIANPPSFPPELVAYTLKLTDSEKGQYGIGLKTDVTHYEDSYDCILNFPAGYGANFAKDGVPTATDPSTILGVKLYKLLCKLGVTPITTEKITREMLFKGKIAMYIDGPWIFTECEIKNPETYPYLDAAHTPFANKAAIGGANHFLMIPKQAKNKSGAGKFIQFWTRLEWQRRHSELTGLVVGNPDAVSDKLLKKSPWFKTYVEGMNYAVSPVPEGFEKQASKFLRAVAEYVVGQAVSKDRPVEEVMGVLQSELLKLR